MAFSSKRNTPASQSSIVLVAFLAVSLVCMLVYFREGDEGPIHSIQEAVSSAFAPVTQEALQYWIRFFFPTRLTPSIRQDGNTV